MTTPTISRANRVILHRRMAAAATRRDNARTVAVGMTLGSVPMSVFAIAWLFTGHMGRWSRSGCSLSS